MINTLINHIENFIVSNPKEAAVGGIFLTVGSEFLKLFNMLHIPDVIVPLLQVTLLVTSITLGFRAISKKDKKEGEK